MSNKEKKSWVFENVLLNEKYDEAFEYSREIASSADKSVELALILEELFVNVMSHAYKEGKGPAIVSVGKTGNIFWVELADCGEEFDPVSYKKEGNDFSLIGGHGIETVKAYADDLKYTRTSGMNVVTAKVKS